VGGPLAKNSKKQKKMGESPRKRKCFQLLSFIFRNPDFSTGYERFKQLFFSSRPFLGAASRRRDQSSDQQNMPLILFFVKKNRQFLLAAKT
jgi:hypothetical protein